MSDVKYRIDTHNFEGELISSEHFVLKGLFLAWKKVREENNGSTHVLSFYELINKKWIEYEHTES